MTRKTLSIVVFALAAGCGTDAEQVVVGRVDRATFPEPVTAVRAVGTASTIEAPIKADGSFTLALPADDRYRIELRSDVRESSLVFQRGSGAIDVSFYVASARAPLDLGRVTYVPQVAAFDGEGGGEGPRDGEKTCGGDVGEPPGGSSEDTAVSEHAAPATIGCESDDGIKGGGDTGGGGGGDTGGGGQDTGGGGQDPGTGGGGS